MTAPEPTAMSLAEAMEACCDEQDRTLFCQRDDVSGAQNDKPLWGSIALSNRHDVSGPFTTWPEAASDALGRPVVERDDAAELVAALHKVEDYLADGPNVAGGTRGYAALATCRSTLAAYRERNK